MPLVDPIRVDAGKLASSNIDRISAAVERDLAELRRQMGVKGRREAPLPKRETIAGYASNVRAWLQNESRRAKEVVVDLSTPGTTKALAQRWASELTFNSGVLDLSVASHPRSLQRLSVFDFAEAAGIEHFGMIVPTQMDLRISPSGVLSQQVGKVRTASEWLAIESRQNAGRRGLSMIFSLGLHHNDPHQMVPIPGALLAAARRQMRKYRESLLRKIGRIGGS